MSDISFDHVIRTRRTARSYRSDPVSEALLAELIELATLAPTAVAAQPWRFSAVSNREVLSQVNVQVKRRLLEKLPEWPFLQRLQPSLESESFNVFYGAPALVVIQCPQRDHVAVMDCLLAAENLILAAHARGLGTCFMGFVLMAQDVAGLAHAIGVQESYQIVAPIVVGYSDAIPQDPPKRKPAEITWMR
jgi:nitroreductase